MYPHRIRLRGPWEAAYASNGQPVTQRITLPARWSQLDALAGPITLTRSFGRPRVLDADESVWLAWSDVGVPGNLMLNGQPIHSLGSDRGIKRIAEALNDRNSLSLRCHPIGESTASLGEFALEIRGPVYLEGLRLETTENGRVITGLVSGEPRENLDLYVLVEGRTVSHQLTHSEAAGIAFRIPCPEATDGPKNPGFPPIRVELVEGATCWWRADFSRESEVPDSPA